jgi:flagellar biosynthesis protein FlhF
MQLETFRGRDLRSLTRHVSHFMGEDAMIVRTQKLNRPGGAVYEVVAAHGQEVEAFQHRISSERSIDLNKTRSVRPYVIALVGPPGAGKTTAAVKIALNSGGFGGKSVGLLTLDTYRVGGVEQLQTYAEIASLPLEVIYHAREVSSAMTRLADRDVIVIDTPGRWIEDSEWAEALDTLAPDEVHFVVPAGLRIDVAKSLKHRYDGAGVSHVLFSKLDEVPAGAGLAEVADALGLSARWISDGPDVPDALSPAGPRIFETLGLRSSPAHTVAV